MDAKIRDYCDNDYKEITRVWNETGMGGEQRGDNKYIIEDTIRNGGKLIVLEDITTGEIIGTSWITTDRRRLYLHHFGIRPVYRSKGYGRLLLEKSLEFAKDSGLQVKLEVLGTNETAINLYKKYGFKNLGDYIVMIIRDLGDNLKFK